MTESEKQPNRKITKGICVGLIAGALSVGIETLLKDSDNIATHKPLLVLGEDQEMTLDDAFDTVRAEIGAGGLFAWNNQLYGTYTQDEWNQLTDDQKTDFANQFNWDAIDTTNSDVAPYAPQIVNSVRAETSDPVVEAVAVAEPVVAEDDTDIIEDDIEIVSVEHETLAQESHNPHAGETTDDSTTDDSEIEILGVVHDSETGANIGSMSVDGQEAILIDIDGDMTFDYMGVDTNGNGRIEPEEMMDIKQNNFSAASMGGVVPVSGTTNISGDVQASNDLPDYSLDANL